MGPSVPLGCFLGLKLVVVFELIGTLTKSNVPSIFEHNMRYLCYSVALCIQINNFSPNGRAKKRQIFEFL